MLWPRLCAPCGTRIYGTRPDGCCDNYRLDLRTASRSPAIGQGGCSRCVFHAQYAPSALRRRCYGDPGGPLAMIDSEPRQARKGATVIIDSCAGVWLSGSPPLRSINYLKTITCINMRHWPVSRTGAAKSCLVLASSCASSVWLGIFFNELNDHARDIFARGFFYALKPW
jgi:hypothetical protein